MSDQTEETKQPEKNLYDFLKTLPDAPTKETIDLWKATHGDVFVTGFSETELFVFRPLLRSEHRKMQMLLQDQQNPIDQFTYEEKVASLCVLYPPAPVDWEHKAGLATTVFEQIMQNSHFYAPSAASMMVMKL
jgi:hypothetical protein